MKTITGLRWKITVAMAVFAIAAGWIGSLAGWRMCEQRQQHSAAMSAMQYRQQLEETLQLSDAQRTQIFPLLDQAEREGIVLTQRVLAETAAVREKLRAQIVPMLTDEQRQRYEEFERSREQRRDQLRKAIIEKLQNKQP